MKIRVFGTEEVNYTSKKTGQQVTGVTVHGEILDQQKSKTQVGNKAFSEFMRCPVPTVGKTYEVEWEEYVYAGRYCSKPVGLKPIN